MYSINFVTSMAKAMYKRINILKIRQVVFIQSLNNSGPYHSTLWLPAPDNKITTSYAPPDQVYPIFGSFVNWVTIWLN